MSFGSDALRYASNVVMIVCNKPRDGSPAAALLSVRLIAFGFPPDSVCIWYRTWPARDCGRPSIFRTAATSPAHWLTPAPYDPVNFPVPPAPPPPPPPLD